MIGTLKVVHWIKIDRHLTGDAEFILRPCNTHAADTNVHAKRSKDTHAGESDGP